YPALRRLPVRDSHPLEKRSLARRFLRGSRLCRHGAPWRPAYSASMPPPIDLNLVRAFIAVHETGSFSTAAARLNLPRSTLSRAVAALEAALGVSLFRRTTRRVSTTSAGEALYARVAPSIAALQSSFADLPDAEAAPSGTLRLTTTVDLAAIVLAEA